MEKTLAIPFLHIAIPRLPYHCNMLAKEISDSQSTVMALGTPHLGFFQRLGSYPAGINERATSD